MSFLISLCFFAQSGVEQLGADDIEVREAATARLMESADPADPELERAIRGQDPEAALRARGILRAALFRQGGPLLQIAEFLENGWAAFLDGNLDRAASYGDALLAADPDFPAALALRKAVRRTSESPEEFKDAGRQIRVMQSEEELHLRAFHLPSRAEWPSVSTLLTFSFQRAQRAGAERQVVVQASSEEMEKIIREIVMRRTPEEVARIAESQRHLQLAFAYNNRGEFEKARIEATKAVEAWHENVAARKVLKDVNRITREVDARSIAEDAAGPLIAVQLEIGKHVRDGERYFNASMYGEALREFENAEFKIKKLPYEVKAAEDLLPGIKEFMLKSRNALDPKRP